MNPYAKSGKAYKAAAVTTEDQGALILMLYDGAIRFCKTAQLKHKKGDIEGVHNNLVKAKDIVSELLSSLDPEKGGDIGQNLNNLYIYIFNKLIDANVQKDMAILAEAEDLLIEMREGWRGITKKVTSITPKFNQSAAVKPVSFKG
ncbi:MAG: flagellar export chaperone FliS [SAR324 cluster bacterium]|nr:flagellar export chaperone FliS [SAR324 cluster bacterium]